MKVPVHSWSPLHVIIIAITITIIAIVIIKIHLISIASVDWTNSLGAHAATPSA